MQPPVLAVMNAAMIREADHAIELPTSRARAQAPVRDAATFINGSCHPHAHAALALASAWLRTRSL